MKKEKIINVQEFRETDTVGNHVIFYIRTELVGKFVTVSLILGEFSWNKEQILCSFYSKPLYQKHFHTSCIFPFKLEQRMKLFARGFV